MREDEKREGECCKTVSWCKMLLCVPVMGSNTISIPSIGILGNEELFNNRLRLAEIQSVVPKRTLFRHSRWLMWWNRLRTAITVRGFWMFLNKNINHKRWYTSLWIYPGTNMSAFVCNWLTPSDKRAYSHANGGWTVQKRSQPFMKLKI